MCMDHKNDRNSNNTLQHTNTFQTLKPALSHLALHFQNQYIFNHKIIYAQT